MKYSRRLSNNRDISSLFRLWPSRDTPSFCTTNLHANYTSAITKYPELAVAYAGRAQCLMWEGHFKHAVDDIGKAIELSNRGDAVHDGATAYFRALLVRCLQGTAQVLRCKAQAKEASWDDVKRTQEVAVRELEEIVKGSVDWAAHIQLAEAILEKDPARALKILDDAYIALDGDEKARASCVEVLLSPDATDEVKLFVKAWFAQVDYACNQSDESFGTSTMKTAFMTLMQDLKHPVGLKAYGSQKKLEKLTDSELEAIVRVTALSHVGDNGFTRPLEIDIIPYKQWDGDAALNLRERMEQFSGNVTLKNGSNVGRLFRKISALEGDSDSYNTKAAVELVKSNTKDKSTNLLYKLVSEVGEPQSTAITSTDVAFFELLGDIDKTYNAIPLGIPGSAAFFAEQKKLAIDLMGQQKDRIRLGQAIAHVAQGHSERALELLTSIVQRDCYFGMHRVLETRANLAKAMGHVEMSDTDFRAMNRLRVSTTDLPKFDNNRKKDDQF